MDIDNTIAVICFIMSIPLMSLILYMFDDKKEKDDNFIKWVFRNYGWKAIKENIKDYLKSEEESKTKE